jgi:putative FmdB family regulatory protein
MPLYEYSCKKCGILEVLQKISEEPLKKCPTCKKKITKVMSVTGDPQFNGSGFYKTDYKKAKS